ncbi:hypothetical protein EMCRGX_G023850 [Ephydatia muelleri]|eukprot:Em0015g2a
MEEFEIVKYRRRKQTKKVIIKQIPDEYTGPPTNELCQKIKLAKSHICKTPFYVQFLRLMESICNEGRVSFSEVLCYGIGHVGMCQTAQHQVALLVAMIEEWKPPHTWVFDPVLQPDETRALEAFGLEMIPKNEACRRTVDAKTLAYMPHCGRAMYNNLLWANWDKEKLHHLIIIGNTFSSYTTRLTAKQLQESWYISAILPYCCEVPLPCSFPFPNVLNDTSIHIFPMQRLAQVPSHVWTNCSQPVVDPNDPEIVL